MDEERHVSRCTVVVQHPGLDTPPLRLLPSLCLPQTLRDLQVKMSIDCLTMWNKLMMNNALPNPPPKKKKPINNTFTFSQL
jgi:hypothetical protein